MQNFVAVSLRITGTVTSELAIGFHPGSELRGALLNALLDKWCQLRDQENACPHCVNAFHCPANVLIGMYDPRHPKSQSIVRPMVIQPPVYFDSASPGNRRRHIQKISAGNPFDFGIGLFGRAANYYLYMLDAVRRLEQTGIGRPHSNPNSKSERGGIQIREAYALNPITGQRLGVPNGQTPTVAPPPLVIRHADILQQPCGDPEHIRLDFITPLTIIPGGECTRVPEFRLVAGALFDRLQALSRLYSDTPLQLPKADLMARAGKIRLVANDTHWVHLQSYSRLRSSCADISGIVGSTAYAGDLTPFWPWLLWGSVTHLGKWAVKGNGYYNVR
jgi:hypothetical protein